MLSALALVVVAGLPQVPALQTNKPELAPLTIAVDEPDYSRPLFTEAFRNPYGNLPERNVRDIKGWQVTAGSVDLLQGTIPGPMGALEDASYVSLGGSIGRPGTIQTAHPLLFLPGVKYALNISYNSPNSGSAEATVRVGGETFQISSHSRGFQRETFTFTFPKATQARLVFQDRGDGHGGIGIGNVSVVPIPGPRVP